MDAEQKKMVIALVKEFLCDMQRVTVASEQAHEIRDRWAARDDMATLLDDARVSTNGLRNVVNSVVVWHNDDHWKTAMFMTCVKRAERRIEIAGLADLDGFGAF